MIDTSMYQGGTLANPAGAFLQGVQMARQMRAEDEQRRMQQQQADALTEQRQALAEERQGRAQAAQAEQAREQALRELFSDPAKVTPGALYSIVGPEKGADILKGLAALDEQHAKTFQTTQGVIGAALGGIKALPEGLRPDGYSMARNNLLQRGLITPEDAPEQYDPGFLDQLERSLMTPEQRYQTDHPTLVQTDPTKDLSDPKTGAVVRPGVPAPPPPPQSYTLGPGQKRFDAQGNVIASVPDRPTATDTDVTTLSPAGLDAAALNYAKTGVLPPLGMGDKNTRKQIINRAAQMMPGLDIASAKADFAANQDSLKSLQKQRDAMGAFESTALKNLDVFLSTAGKIADSGSPLANRAIRSFSESVLGNPDMTAYQTARRTVIPEFAKILANPGLSGQLSDSARKEIEDVVRGDATLKQIVAAARVLKTDVQNRTRSYDDQIEGIRQRLATAQQPSGGGKPDPLGIRTAGAPK